MRTPFLNYLAFVLLFSTAVSAQIPKTMSYQGVLADTADNAVADGNYNLTFRIYDVASGGTELWMETQSIPVVDGIFNAILGSATPLNLAFDQPYWLGVSVDGGTELSPRIELTSVPYSLEPDSGGAGDGHSLDAADGDPVDAVYVDNDGKVGVGTTNPGYQMDIRGNDPDDGVLIQVGNSDATHVLRFYGGRLNDPSPFIQWVDGDPLRFASTTNGFTEWMRVQNNGNVGIGTPTPTEKLQVDGVIHSMTGGFKFPDGSVQTSASTIGSSPWQTSGNDIYYDTGNVGIGITTPSAALDIRGAGPDDGVIFNIGNSDATHFLRLFGGRQNDPNPFVLWKSGDPLRFSTDSSGFNELMRINGNGTVGIGTQNPYSNTKLHVASHNRYAGYFASDSLSDSTNVIHAEYNGLSGLRDVIAVYGKSVPAPFYGIGGSFEGGWRGAEVSAITAGPGMRYGLYATGGNGDGNNFGVYGLAYGGVATFGVYGYGAGGSSINYAVYASGDLAYTGSLINASDAKLKENVRPLTGSLNKLMRLKPKVFNFTSDPQYKHMNLPTGEHYGLIAQEVEQVLPELVSDNNHPSAAESSGEKSDDPPISYKGLNYIELIPVLIEAVKEQQTIIEKQQQEINQLRSEINH